MPSSPQWVFDRFRLDPDHACLWRGAEVIALPPKAFDLLHYFVRHPDRVVTKDELLDAVWPQTAVTEAVVRVAIGLLRKVLGDTAQTPRFIATVARRGYRFLAPVSVVHPPEMVHAEAPQQRAVPAPRSPEAVLPTSQPMPSTGDHVRACAGASTSRLHSHGPGREDHGARDPGRRAQADHGALCRP